MEIKKALLLTLGISAIVFLGMSSCLLLTQKNHLKELYKESVREVELAKSSYAILKEGTDAEHALLLEAIEKAEATVIEREVIRTELVYVEPVQPELESEPLVINLRAQIANLNDIVTEKNKIIFSLKEDYKIEHTLRLGAEDGWSKEAAARALANRRIQSLEWSVRKYKLQASLGKVGGIILLAVGGYVIYTGATK